MSDDRSPTDEELEALVVWKGTYPYFSRTDFGRAVWKAAAKHERERCADLCERLVRDNSDAGECADAIRNRVAAALSPQPAPEAKP